MYRCVLLVCLLTVGALGCDILTDDGISGPDSGVIPFISMEWLNNIISAWYTVNDEQVCNHGNNIWELNMGFCTFHPFKFEYFTVSF